MDKALDALADPEKITVVQVAPAVRAAWGESFGLTREFASVKRLVRPCARSASIISLTPISAPTSPSWRRAVNFWSA